MQPKDEIDSLRQYANTLDAEIAQLERRYGTGIRPAWVGDEIGIKFHYAARARAKADEKEAALAST